MIYLTPLRSQNWAAKTGWGFREVGHTPFPKATQCVFEHPLPTTPSSPTADEVRSSNEPNEMFPL